MKRPASPSSKMSDESSGGSSTPSALPLRDVNCHLICTVCRGYYVDATTITECLHSFCRSCVVPHVTEFHSCPTCSVPLSSTKPFSQLRRDYTLQSIVYKLVPQLARKELERRQQYLIKTNRSCTANTNEERYLQSFFAPDDPISLSLEYADSKCAFGLRRRISTDMEDPDEPPSAEGSIHNRRYFRCPANLPIGHLVRFLRCKFDVVDPAINKLEILYNGHPLSPEFKLADVAYIFSWKEREPLRLWYRITPAEAAPEVTLKPEVKVDEPIQPPPPPSPPPKVTSPPPQQTMPEDAAVNVTSRNQQRASLVDITRSLQCWNSPPKKESAPERPDLISPAKRRKRDKPIPVKIQKPIAPKPPPPPPLPPPTAAAPNIFDVTRPEEFSCSTPIPTPGNNSVVPAVELKEADNPVENLSTDADGNTKPFDWLPKAVFNLDDRALLAKRLQRIIPSVPGKDNDDDDNTTAAAVESATIKTEEPEADVDPIESKMEEEEEKTTTTKEPDDVIIKADSETLLDPLTICTSTADEEKIVTDEVVHDSIGALDLSGSSSRSDHSADPSPSPASASGSSPGASSSTPKIGPHPFFMTPSSIYIQSPDESCSSSKTKKVVKKQKKKMLWDLFQPTSPAPSGSLLSLIQQHRPISKPSN